MTISYNWLCKYLPEQISISKLSKILTSIGLEVESILDYVSIPGGLEGLIVGEVRSCEKHPDADKLQVTQIFTGEEVLLQIVCGAANVAIGQKVVVAPVGTTIYPTSGDPFIIKKAKIRGVESYGMLCAEDEIGLGNSHEGIMILDAERMPGAALKDMFEVYKDQIIEIGLTPNRMDAMSHQGVAKDVIAYLNHHEKTKSFLKLTKGIELKSDKQKPDIEVEVTADEACPRYCGLHLLGVVVAPSPDWLKNALKAIGVKPINNIVDATNYILHDTGQPLHAFDAAKIKGKKVIVKLAEDGQKFTTLDGKEHTLLPADLMICDGDAVPMCLAGIYGGMGSGVTNETTSIFLESAWFSPQSIRRSSVRHGLRTDAAARFEKGVDISNCLTVLKQAAALICELSGAQVSGGITDHYPKPREATTVRLKYHYLKKLSGKNYHGDTVQNILSSLGFTIVKDSPDELTVNVPFSKPDITLPADLVEEVMRIDGLDNIEIPSTISIAPSVGSYNTNHIAKEKAANYLTGLGFHEIFTNSITDSKYYNPEDSGLVKMINNLSADLDVMRPSMLETGLEVISYNINRKNESLKLFETGKTYHQQSIGVYNEQQHLALFITGDNEVRNWVDAVKPVDFYYLKETCANIFRALGIEELTLSKGENGITELYSKGALIAKLQEVDMKKRLSFQIKQPVFYADILWDEVLRQIKTRQSKFVEITKFPAVQRDLSLVIDAAVPYSTVQETVGRIKLPYLQNVRLFDVFEGEKLGKGKKAMALNFTFLDREKTLTDKEVDAHMDKLIKAFTTDINAEIRGL